MSATKSFSVSKALNTGWELTKKHFWFLMLVLLLSQVVPGIISGMGGEEPNILLSLVSWIYSIIVQIGLIVVVLKLVDEKKASWQDLYSSYKLFLQYFLGSLLYGIVVLLGFLFFIIPGFYLALKYQYTLFLIVDKKMGPMAAFKKSGEITKGNLMQLFWYSMASIGVVLLGFLALFVGIFVAIPVVTLGNAWIYRQLLKKS